MVVPKLVLGCRSRDNNSRIKYVHSLLRDYGTNQVNIISLTSRKLKKGYDLLVSVV